MPRGQSKRGPNDLKSHSAPRYQQAGSEDNPNLQFYEQIAGVYDNLYAEVDVEEAVRQWRLLVKRCAGLPVRRRVTLPKLLDIGCGTGRYLAFWAAAGFDVTGVDASSKMIARASRRRRRSELAPRIHLLRSDIRYLNHRLEKKGPFDVAVAHFNFFNLFPLSELKNILRSLSMCVRSGSRLFTDCASPALMPPSDRDRLVLQNGLVIEVLTSPEATSETVTKFYYYNNMQTHEKYWMHPLKKIKAAAMVTGWQLESVFAWRPDSPLAPWRPLGKSDDHRVFVLRKD